MDDLEGSVHGQHRHTDIQHGDAAVCDILGDGAAAAQVQTAQLTDLPCNRVISPTSSAQASLAEPLLPPPVYLKMATPRPA